MRSTPTSSSSREAVTDIQEQPGAGMPDGWQRIWMPERMAYIKGEGKDGCPFCEIPTMTDEDGLIVSRGGSVYAVLNLYPYNSGHLMVVPFQHVASIEKLDSATLTELMEQAQLALRALHLCAHSGIGLGSA